ncbi:hypothetical protein DB88DRAFT_64297 [Papiliotrema laurentii]|uniref:Secreted protein n=1 Tax=Papiliotrema laurentii TaxID=5418 RepID=A0AAD9FM57_PAPLA|nr:hypothetical protein DB88DRAFT_64297 [Papiliotrema laurentii]
MSSWRTQRLMAMGYQVLLLSLLTPRHVRRFQHDSEARQREESRRSHRRLGRGRRCHHSHHHRDHRLHLPQETQKERGDWERGLRVY